MKKDEGLNPTKLIALEKEISQAYEQVELETGAKIDKLKAKLF